MIDNDAEFLKTLELHAKDLRHPLQFRLGVQKALPLLRALFEERSQTRAALEEAERQFLFYAEQHDAKGTEEGTKKAQVNRDMAVKCRAALGEIGVPVKVSAAVPDGEARFVQDGQVVGRIVGLSERAGGWPDPTRPGVLVGEQERRRHWLQAHSFMSPCLFWWWPRQEHWTPAEDGWAEGDIAPTELASWRYLGPCLTPAEVAALVAAAERRGIEQAAGRVEVMQNALSSEHAQAELDGDTEYARRVWQRIVGVEKAHNAIRALLTTKVQPKKEDSH
ncbi:hypothetical protein [Planktothrix phage Pra-JY27]|nr:hypothetical protein [Planktothrix phage Pag-Yong1]WEV89223.1 hypothetical protein [Synechococcus phage MinM2]